MSQWRRLVESCSRSYADILVWFFAAEAALILRDQAHTLN
jgi:hypothetical protein